MIDVMQMIKTLTAYFDSNVTIKLSVDQGRQLFGIEADFLEDCGNCARVKYYMTFEYEQFSNLPLKETTQMMCDKIIKTYLDGRYNHVKKRN